MKSASEIASDLRSTWDNPRLTIRGRDRKILALIRAAQIDAAEWMREEAAKDALGCLSGDDHLMAQVVAQSIRSIMLPGETI